jgi:hypothetical protein
MDNKERISEYDQTKKMLNLLRGDSLTTLKENEVKTNHPNEFNEDSTKFMDIVTPRVTFTNFELSPEKKNITIGGKLDNGIEFQLSKTEGLYFSCPNIELDAEILDILKKLSGYYENWSIEWAKKLNTEY